jgi:non-heme chloroperoxidase
VGRRAKCPEAEHDGTRDHEDAGRSNFGGLITQQVAGLGLATVSVPIDPAPFRGVLPLPRSALKAAFPVLGNPLNYRRSVMLTAKQFRYAFANAVSETKAKEMLVCFIL